jgi:hypothetical protein
VQKFGKPSSTRGLIQIGLQVTEESRKKKLGFILYFGDMVEHTMIAECFPHKCGNSGPIFSSKNFLCIIGTSVYFFYFFIFFWGLLLGCQNLSGKKKQKKQTNKPCGKTAEL